MKITIAGQDRTADVGQAIRAWLPQYQDRPRPALVPPEISALRLGGCASEAEYEARYLNLMRYRDNVDTLPYHMPRRPGVIGAVMLQVRRGLWRFLRYQHERITFRQNLINRMFTSGLEFEQAQRAATVAALERRIAELEARLSGGEPDGRSHPPH